MDTGCRLESLSKAWTIGTSEKREREREREREGEERGKKRELRKSELSARYVVDDDDDDDKLKMSIFPST